MILAFISGLLLAYANGANDNFKGVATLYGGGTVHYRQALRWATLTTFAGSALAFVLAQDLTTAFRGKGLVADSVIAQPSFALAVALAAAFTVFIAAHYGWPISTTHALVGGLLGAGLTTPGGVHPEQLGKGFLLPLLVSPLLAIAGTALLYPIFHFYRRRWGVERHSALGSAPEAERGLNFLHFLSSGLVGFARGLNDTPKITGVMLAAAALPGNAMIVCVAVFMALGGWFHSRRVAHTLSHRITDMNPGQGFTANLVTGVLVIAASRLGLPVSTTHVAVGGLFGLGAVTGGAHWKPIGQIVLSWVLTLPTAVVLSALFFFVLRNFGI